jgi:hypothetical protein
MMITARKILKTSTVVLVVVLAGMIGAMAQQTAESVPEGKKPKFWDTLLRAPPIPSRWLRLTGQNPTL